MPKPTVERGRGFVYRNRSDHALRFDTVLNPETGATLELVPGECSPPFPRPLFGGYDSPLESPWLELVEDGATAPAPTAPVAVEEETVAPTAATTTEVVEES